MTKQHQGTQAKPERKSQTQVKLPAVEELPDDLIAMTKLPAGPSATTNGGNVEAHAGRLGDPRLPTAQRQALATQIGWMGGNQHLQRVVVALERARRETRTAPAQFNVALYDYNLDHMHVDGEETLSAAARSAAHERQRNAFRDWAQQWARRNRAIGPDGITPGRAIEMNVRQEILDGINNTYRAANQENADRNVPEAQWRKIDTVAFFCHGSSNSGLVRLGVRDPGSFLTAIQGALSPQVRFFLFACSTGQGRWQRGMIRSEREVESPEIREEYGGEGSWAARLAEALVRRGMDLGEEWRGAVWGHTTSGTAVGLPNWRQFQARFERLDPVTRQRIYAIQGRSYFAYVFDAQQVTLTDMYLRSRYEGMSPRVRAARRKEFPVDAMDLRNRWMYPFYLSIARGEIASRVPEDPDGCKEQILSAWRRYYTGHSAAALSGRGGGRWILANNFDDLPTHIPERSIE